MDKIRVKELQIRVERNPKRKKELQKQLTKLQLRREIEAIKEKIKTLGG